MKRYLIILSIICHALIAIGQNGKLLSKKLVDLSQDPFWQKITDNDTLIPLKYSQV